VIYTILATLSCQCERLVTDDQAFAAASKQQTKAFCSRHGLRTIIQVLNPLTDNWLPYRVPLEWYEPS